MASLKGLKNVMTQILFLATDVQALAKLSCIAETGKSPRLKLVMTKIHFQAMGVTSRVKLRKDLNA